MEEWKDIEGYEGLYQISSEGRVKSLNYNHTGKDKILNGSKNKYGYLKVCLYKEGKKKTHTIHRLVTIAFIPNPNNFPEINHIDEDKTNNRVENLEYCDRKYNINYGNRNEKMAKSLSKPILQFSLDGKFIRKWDSGMQVQKDLGFDNSNITKCCKGRKNYKSVGGFIWGYADDYERIPFKVFDLEIYRKIA